MFYPLKFEPLYKNYIWGGKNLQSLGKKLPNEKVAESWELSCHPDGMSVIANGIFRGKTLQSVIDEHREKIAGSFAQKKFPLLVKLIDANDKLSVQVHPDDAYALANEGESGKNEMWYIIDAKPGATLIYGIKPGINKERFARAVKENKVEDCLHTIPVQAGDFVNIPAGTVHAIEEGIVLAEVQQNSNMTYRIYDYNRLGSDGNPRPLHLEKALDVIDFHTEIHSKQYEGLQYELSGCGTAKMLVANNYFCVEVLTLTGRFHHETSYGQFHIYLCMDGEGNICWQNKEMSFSKGETVLVPASLGKYTIDGNLKCIHSYVPDIERDIFGRLQELGFSRQEILSRVSGIAGVTVQEPRMNGKSG